MPEEPQKGSETFVHDLLGVNRRTVGTTTTYFTRTPDGTVIGQRTGTARNYFLLDGLNSVIAVTGPRPDGTIDVLASYAYDPYGNTTSPEPGGASSPFRYANYLFDSETQLYKVGLRYLDPSVGRWTQRDAIDNPLDERGWNRYVYVGNDPVNFTDPSGAFGIRDVLDFGISCASGALVGAITGGLGGVALGCIQSVVGTAVCKYARRSACVAVTTAFFLMDLTAGARLLTKYPRYYG